MKQREVEVGRTYTAKVSERLVPVTLLRESRWGGWDGRNEATGREIHIRSAQRLRRRVMRCTFGGCGQWTDNMARHHERRHGAVA